MKTSGTLSYSSRIFVFATMAPTLTFLAACSDTKKGPPDDGGDDAVAQVVAAKQSHCALSYRDCALKLADSIGSNAADSVIIEGCATGEATQELNNLCL